MERHRIESLSSSEEGDEPTVALEDLDFDTGSITAPFTPSKPYPRRPSEIQRLERQEENARRGKCVDGNLLILKLLLFLFFGGIGVISTWLNHYHLVTSQRFTERESLLIYGLAGVLSIFLPFVVGLISDKTAHPRKVLGICLILTGLLYPLIMTVPPSHPYRYKDILHWCSNHTAASNSQHHLSCLPQVLHCGPSEGPSELITPPLGGCSQGCGGQIIITKCKFECNKTSLYDQGDEEDEEYDYSNQGPQAQALKIGNIPLANEAEVLERLGRAPPHLCVKDETKSGKMGNLCHVMDKDMHKVGVNLEGLEGYFVEEEGRCHYPIKGESGSSSTLSCSPLSEGCHVSCDLQWNKGDDTDQWTCQSDFVQWLISFISFVGIHTLGTMLLISSTALLNSCILSMSHEHSGYFGVQYMYGVLGYAVLPPGVLLLFDVLHDLVDIPWKVEYLIAYSIWLLVCGILVSCLPFHAEWVPKPRTVGPMLRRWTCRGHTLLFFLIIAVLGSLQTLVDVLAYHQIKDGVKASMLTLALGSTAAVAPSILFIFRVDKVIDYCAYPNVFGIAMVVLSLQFTGYAYLLDVVAEWSYLLRAMETFSVLMVWITASYTTYAAAPRSLVATCQAIIVTLYCCIGRGFGGILGFLGLSVMPKDVFLKGLALLSVFICAVFLTVQYCCLKPFPYAKPYEVEGAGGGGLAPSGRYTPLKLINGKDKDRNLAKGEDLQDLELKSKSSQSNTNPNANGSASD